ncbi:hypothetical protein FQA39_LY01707 [Lamprigera yunnana]|nr:hypothetical protein FQA39_LY01707 [Lamprigera yunnana]
MSELEGEVSTLDVEGIIGFDGAIIGGIRVHPDGEHVLFPIGNKVTIQHWNSKKQYFLCGHTNVISAIDISRSGNYVASGQINHIGFRAWVIVWDFHKRSILTQHEIHKVRVEAVKFSMDDQYVTSLGGRDCGNIVVWDVAACAPLSGIEATSGIKGEASALCACNRRRSCFITGGDANLTIWGINVEERAISGVDVLMSKLKRNIYCIDINERDEVCYCGTSTGDILKIRLNYHHDAEVLMPVRPPLMQGCFTKISKKKLAKGCVELYAQGVRSLLLLKERLLLVGAGNGDIELVEELKPRKLPENDSVAFKLPSVPVLKVIKSTNIKSSITSIQIFRGHTILAGTVNCEIFSINLDTFDPALIVTCHSSTIYCLAFPYQFSEVFATGAKNDVRIWNMATFQELLRIKVANFSCSSLDFAHDGKSLLTGWNDGIIRAFTPLTGRLMYAILDAHNKGVSALAVTHNGKYIVSGGCEGQVRIWSITSSVQSLVTKLTAHNGPISEIHINANDDEAISSSTDGSCIIWDLIRHSRKQVLFANTLFMCVRYYPTGVQVLTSGGDRKIGYWEVYDGNLVREVEGSPSGSINSLDISSDGKLFATGGNDQIVKVWKYQEGITTHIGIGHSAVITAIRFSPNRKIIVSASAAGSIFFWKNPFYEESSKPQESIKTENIHKEEEAEIVCDPTPKPSSKPKPKSVISLKLEENVNNLPSARSSTHSIAPSMKKEAAKTKSPSVKAQVSSFAFHRITMELSLVQLRLQCSILLMQSEDNLNVFIIGILTSFMVCIIRPSRRLITWMTFRMFQRRHSVVKSSA